MMTYHRPSNVALSLGFLIAIQGCSTVPSQAIKPTPLPAPATLTASAIEAMPPTAPEVSQEEKPAEMGPDKILVGKTYLRAFIPPKLLDKQWKRLLRMDLGTTAGDFLLLGNLQQKMVVFASPGRRIKGKTSEYTIVDELQLPAALDGISLARCAWHPNAPKSVLAAFSDTSARIPSWAVTLSTSGKIQLLLNDERTALHCKEKPQLLR